MRARLIVLVAVVLIISTHGFTEEIEPTAIFKEVTAKYKSMQTYKAQGTIVFDTDSNLAKRNMETSFSMVLKKPNLYLVSWTMKRMSRPGMAQSGAVWNVGDQPYLYMGIINAYSFFLISLKYGTIVNISFLMWTFFIFQVYSKASRIPF